VEECGAAIRVRINLIDFVCSELGRARAEGHRRDQWYIQCNTKKNYQSSTIRLVAERPPRSRVSRFAGRRMDHLLCSKGRKSGAGPWAGWRSRAGPRTRFHGPRASPGPGIEPPEGARGGDVGGARKNRPRVAVQRLAQEGAGAANVPPAPHQPRTARPIRRGPPAPTRAAPGSSPAAPRGSRRSWPPAIADSRRKMNWWAEPVTSGGPRARRSS